jgi:hypothetical protein
MPPQDTSSSSLDPRPGYYDSLTTGRLIHFQKVFADPDRAAELLAKPFIAGERTYFVSPLKVEGTDQMLKQLINVYTLISFNA